MLAQNEKTYSRNCDKPEDFCIDGSEIVTKEVLSKLKFISKIKSSQKINVVSMRPSENTFFSWINRKWWEGETFDDTYIFLDKTIQEAFELCRNYSTRPDSFYKEMGLRINNSLVGVKTGLNSLKETYSNNVMYVSKIESIEETLDAKICFLERYMK